MIVMTVALIIYFSFFIFNVNSTIGEQWKTYVNPFNQIHFFFGGYIMGLLFMKRNTNKILSRILLFIGLLLFCFYPVQGDRIHLVTGMNRIVFIAVCFMITYGVYKDDYKLTGFVKRGLLFLGEASYSIYLLHQIVFFCVNGVNTKFLHFNKSLVIALSVASTFAAAYIVYTFFEKPLTEKGRVVIKKIINRP
jgi:peptidoglycan/LPS O-acetylase OafA/YrhL